MKATDILKWLSIEQGSSTKRDIVSLWRAWPDSDYVWVEPGSRLERIGLQACNGYHIGSAFLAIGCTVAEEA